MRLIRLLLFIGYALSVRDGYAVQASFSDNKLIIKDCSTTLCVPDIYEGEARGKIVHAVARVEDQYFIVIGVQGWTWGQLREDRGHCGEGREAYLEWLRVKGGQVMERSKKLYESCIDNRMAWNVRWEKGLLVAECDDLVEKSSKWLRYTWTYNSKRPDHGFAETVKDLN